jgi:hypothetical protein
MINNLSAFRWISAYLYYKMQSQTRFKFLLILFNFSSKTFGFLFSTVLFQTVFCLTYIYQTHTEEQEAFNVGC